MPKRIFVPGVEQRCLKAVDLLTAHCSLLLQPPPAAPEGAHLDPASGGVLFFVIIDDLEMVDRWPACWRAVLPIVLGEENLLLNAVRRIVLVILVVAVADREEGTGKDKDQDSEREKAEGSGHRGTPAIWNWNAGL
jgi:hypothetical protein